MTSCRNRFHNFLFSLSWLSLCPLLYLCACHPNNIKQRVLSTVSPQFPLMSAVFLFVLLLCYFRDVSRQKCLPTNHLSSQMTCSYKDKEPFWLLYVGLPISSLTLCLPLCTCLYLSSHLCRITHCAISLLVCPCSSLHPHLPSVAHLSLPFTNQYAGQQAVWQIVCCEPHERPLSIISVRYWIQSDVFSRVKWKDQGVQHVRWGESEGRPAVDLSLFVTAQLQVFLSERRCLGCLIIHSIK